MLSNCAALILWNPEASFLRQARTGAFRCKLHAPFFPGRNGWEEGKTIPVQDGVGRPCPCGLPSVCLFRARPEEMDFCGFAAAFITHMFFSPYFIFCTPIKKRIKFLKTQNSIRFLYSFYRFKFSCHAKRRSTPFVWSTAPEKLQYSGAEAANTGKSNERLVTITLPILYTRDWSLSTQK